MTKTSTPPNCIGCRKMNKPFYNRRQLNCFSEIGIIILSIFLFLSVLPAYAQNESEKAPTTRKENKESRLKKSMA
jgi:hypothetical protein